MTDNTMRAAALKPVARAWMQNGKMVNALPYWHEWTDYERAHWEPKGFSYAPLYNADQLAAARAEGYKAGMEKAAEICHQNYGNGAWNCMLAIRAEIGKEGA